MRLPENYVFFLCERYVVSAIPGDLSNLNCCNSFTILNEKSEDRHFACFSNLLILVKLTVLFLIETLTNDLYRG